MRSSRRAARAGLFVLLLVLASNPAARAEGVRKDPAVAKGEALYAKYCALCHGKDRRGYAADRAPSLVSPELLSGADDAFLAGSIARGRPGTAMAAYGKAAGGPLDDAAIGEIITYLRSQGPAARPLEAHPKGNASRGAAVYAASCESCHGGPAKRSTEAPQLTNPIFLALASDAYMFDAIARGRTGTPMVAFAKRLDARQIADVVAYLRDLGASAPAAPAGVAGPAATSETVINPDGEAPDFAVREDRFVSVDEVAHALAEKKRMVIVDARVASDFQRSHIPGAISVPYYELASLDRIPNDGSWVIAYCACPHHASGEIVDELKRRGYPHAVILDEGILVWEDRGYPLTRGNGGGPSHASQR